MTSPPFGYHSYFYLLFEFIRTGFKAKDQRSVLGFLWSFLNPLITTVILYFLFRARMSSGAQETYFPYILIGIVMWNFFVMSIRGSISILVSQANLVKSATFPKEIMIFKEIGVFIVQLVFELCAVFLFLLFFSEGVSWHALLFPAVVGLEALLIGGIALILSCLCVWTRDIQHIWNVLTHIGFFLVPVFYSVNDISERFRWIVDWNPLSQIFSFARDLLLYHRLPAAGHVLAVGIFCLTVFGGGLIFFRHVEAHVMEYV